VQACSHKKMQGYKKQGVYGYVQFIRDLAVAAFLLLSVISHYKFHIKLNRNEMTEPLPLKSNLKLLAIVSRPEFIPANSASLMIGVAWALQFPTDIVAGVLLPTILTYAIISLVAMFAAQINTLSDYEADTCDSTKKRLTDALETLGIKNVRISMAVELMLSLILMIVLYEILGEIVLVLLWFVGVFFAYSYSSPPIRFKSRTWLAMISLMLVLSIIPISFVYYSIESTFQLFFFIFLIGQALTVYGVIVPAEIRDFFMDKSSGISTLTVHLGLVRASALAIFLLTLGGLLCGTGLFLGFAQIGQSFLAFSLLIMAFVYATVLRHYFTLYQLSRRYQSSKNEEISRDIIELATRNPKWITWISQSIVLMCIILIVGKLLAFF